MWTSATPSPATLPANGVPEHAVRNDDSAAERGKDRPDRLLHVLHARARRAGADGAVWRVLDGDRGRQEQHGHDQRPRVFLRQAYGRRAGDGGSRRRAGGERGARESRQTRDHDPDFQHLCRRAAGLEGGPGRWRVHRHRAGVLLPQEGPRFLPHRADRLRPARRSAGFQPAGIGGRGHQGDERDEGGRLVRQAVRAVRTLRAAGPLQGHHRPAAHAVCPPQQ